MYTCVWQQRRRPRLASSTRVPSPAQTCKVDRGSGSGTDVKGGIKGGVRGGCVERGVDVRGGSQGWTSDRSSVYSGRHASDALPSLHDIRPQAIKSAQRRSCISAIPSDGSLIADIPTPTDHPGVARPRPPRRSETFQDNHRHRFRAIIAVGRGGGATGDAASCHPYLPPCVYRRCRRRIRRWQGRHSTDEPLRRRRSATATATAAVAAVTVVVAEDG